MFGFKTKEPSKISQQAFIFIGRSGCGKGTQANLLIKALGEKDSSREVLYIQTGQEFRKFIQGRSFTAKKSNEYYETDKLQPEFLSIRMWVDLLVQKYNGNQHLIFDGTPRKLHEAGVLNSIFGFYGITKPNVININISADEALGRLLLRKRLDDAPEDVKKRLGWYETDVVPTIEYFRNNPNYNFMEIEGNRSVEEVHADIVNRLGLV